MQDGDSGAVQAAMDDGSDIEEVAIELEDSPVKPKKAAPKRKLGPKADGPAKAKAPAAKRGRKKDSGSSEDEKPKKVN